MKRLSALQRDLMVELLARGWSTRGGMASVSGRLWSSVCDSVGTMSDAGLLERRPHLTDQNRLAWQYRLTPKGEQLAEALKDNPALTAVQWREILSGRTRKRATSDRVTSTA